jgi:hypothetical protein
MHGQFQEAQQLLQAAGEWESSMALAVCSGDFAALRGLAAGLQASCVAQHCVAQHCCAWCCLHGFMQPAICALLLIAIAMEPGRAWMEGNCGSMGTC